MREPTEGPTLLTRETFAARTCGRSCLRRELVSDSDSVAIGSFTYAAP
jgi:hypothetical protein